MMFESFDKVAQKLISRCQTLGCLPLGESGDSDEVWLSCPNENCSSHEKSNHKAFSVNHRTAKFYCFHCGLAGQGLEGPSGLKAKLAEGFPLVATPKPREFKPKEENQDNLFIFSGLVNEAYLYKTLQEREWPEAAREYIRKRGMLSSFLQAHKVFVLGAGERLDFMQHPVNCPTICFPHFNKLDKVDFVVYRPIEGTINLNGVGEKPIYQTSAMKKTEPVLVLTEGVWDMFSAYIAGYQSVALLGRTFTTKHDLSIFKDKQIVIALDGDVTNKDISNLATRLQPIAKSVHVAAMPNEVTSDGRRVKDPNDVLVVYGPEKLKQAIQQALEPKAEPKEKEKVMTSDEAGLNIPIGKQAEEEEQLKGKTASGKVIFPLTDLGNAERFASRHQKDLRYLDNWSQWLVWDGRRWASDNVRAVVRRGKETVRAMYQDVSKITDDDQRKTFVKWTRASESRVRLDAMIELAKSESGIPITPRDLDKDLMLLNVQNGTVDLRTGELRPHRREDLITKIAPVEYRPDAECPLWLKFLNRIMDDNQNLIRFLQRAVGYSLTGDVSEHCLFFMYGTGRNGKSTFIETLKALYGDYAQKAPTEMLMRKKFDGGIPNDVARLQGARLVVVAEVEEGRRLSESVVKDLTGGDTLTARFLRQEFFDFEPTHKIWMYGNHKPIIRGTDEAIWSRIPLIPFTVFIPPKERDPGLRKKLCKELPGILRWVVEGCLEWQKKGLNFPDEVIEATKAYQAEMDMLSDFLTDCCVIFKDAWVGSTDLFVAYQDWAKENSEQYPLGKKTFMNRLVGRGFTYEIAKIGGKTRRIWRGVGVAAECENKSGGK